MAVLDKDDIGLVGGGGLAAIVAASTGLGAFGIAAAAVGGAYLGHKIFEYYGKKAYSY